MFFRTVIFCCCLLPYVLSVDSKAPAKSIIQGPQNEAIEQGPGLLLPCQASDPGATVEWREYITNPSGATISLNNQTLPGHPNAARYTILVNSGTLEYNLLIEPTILADGGTYRCQDNSDSSQPAYAQLVMIDGPPVCNSNIPGDGTVAAYQYYTIECNVTYRGNAAPIMTWTGPEEWRGTWSSVVTITNTSVWSGVNMNMSKFFDDQTFSVLVNFTEAGFILPNSASNIPEWNFTYTSPVLNVFWRPTQMYIIPEQSSYEIGDEIVCMSDGNPIPDYFWQNGATNEFIYNQTLVLRVDNVGTTTFRCNAQNAYGSNDLFVQIVVNPVTTSTTPTTTTTTTPPPAEGDCYDLTGRWGATTPSPVDLCIQINNTNGLVIGLVRNATDPYFIEVRGQVVANKFDEIGFVGVWPVNIGTQAFTGVCSNCYGTEHLQITAVGRVIGDFNTCSDFGALRLFQFYDFVRTGPPCRSLFREYGVTL